MVAFVFSVLVMLAMVAVVLWEMNRRPADAPLTWGEAMIGSFWVTGILFLCFGVIPHQWIVWADSDLGWRKDRFLAGPGEVLSDLPFDIPYTALRDSVVVILHVIFVAGLIVLWSKWQKRGEQVTEEAVASDYGRPLIDSET